MTRGRMLPRAVLPALLGLVTAVILAGCAPEPDELRDAARDAFDAAVTAASGVPATVLRSLEEEPVRTEACENDADAEREVYQATGTLAVEAMETDAAEVHRAVADSLDPQRWDEIRTGDASLGEAWADETGIVLSAASRGSLVAITVFTPCHH